MLRLIFLSGLVVVLAAPAGVPWFHHARAEPPPVKEREKSPVEADSPVKASVPDGRREEVEKAVAAIRGLPFTQPVDYQVLDRKQIQATVAGKLAEVFTEAEFSNLTAAYVRLGLLPPGYPLREKYIELLGEQVAAFYDQHAHKLFMFEDASLENAANRVVLAHELTHALQDQHFGLRKLPLEIKTNDDRAGAASALVEGDATLVMTEFMLKNLSLDSLQEGFAGAFTQNMEQLAAAPRFLRESLLFPYLQGQQFCGAIHSRGGYAALNKAYERPPSSTTQIMHPEKYFSDPPEEPIAVEWPNLSVNGEKPIADNVLGEFGINILFAEHKSADAAARAAAGWRGDRYLCYARGEALVWKSIWASKADAAEFAEAEKEVLSARYGSSTARVLVWAFPREHEVVLIDAPDEEWASALKRQFAQ